MSGNEKYKMGTKRHRGKFDPSNLNPYEIPNHTPKGDNFMGCDIGRYAKEMIEALKL